MCERVWHFWSLLTQRSDSHGFGREKLKEWVIPLHSLGTPQCFEMSYKAFECAPVSCEMWFSPIKNSVYNRRKVFDTYSSPTCGCKMPLTSLAQNEVGGNFAKELKKTEKDEQSKPVPLVNSMIWLCLHIRLVFGDLWASVHIYQIANSTTYAQLVIKHYHTAE